MIEEEDKKERVTLHRSTISYESDMIIVGSLEFFEELKLIFNQAKEKDEKIRQENKVKPLLTIKQFKEIRNERENTIFR